MIFFQYDIYARTKSLLYPEDSIAEKYQDPYIFRILAIKGRISIFFSFVCFSSGSRRGFSRRRYRNLIRNCFPVRLMIVLPKLRILYGFQKFLLHQPIYRADYKYLCCRRSGCTFSTNFSSHFRILLSLVFSKILLFFLNMLLQ